MPDDPGLTKWLQTSLNTIGLQPELKVDGITGPLTTAAVLEFQRAEGIVQAYPPLDTITQSAIVAVLQGARKLYPTTNQEIDAMTTAVATAAAPTQNQTVLAVLTKMEASIEPQVVALADKLLPWFVPAALVNGIIHDGLMKGVALAAGATTGVVQSIPTAQQIVSTALAWADKETPSWLKGIVAPLEEQVIIGAQKLGILPPDFSIEHAPTPAAKAA